MRSYDQKGGSVLVISLGVFTYIFALLVPAVAFAITAVRGHKWAKCIVIAGISYWLTVCMLSDIFPLHLYGESIPLILDDWTWFGFIYPPFYGFPLSFDSVLTILQLYWQAWSFGLILGFIATLGIQLLRKPIPMVLFALGSQVLLILAKIIPCIITNGRNSVWDVSETILTLIFYLVGYAFAIAAVKLIPSITKLFDGKRPPRAPINSEDI